MSELIKQLLLGGSGTPKMPVALRRFTTADEIISRDTVEVQGKSWLVEVRESQVVRFFEVPEPDAEHCLLTYRAALKSKDLAGRAFLEMWCRFPVGGVLVLAAASPGDISQDRLLWSQETYRIFGLRPGGPLTYQTFLSRVHPDDLEVGVVRPPSQYMCKC